MSISKTDQRTAAAGGTSADQALKREREAARARAGSLQRRAAVGRTAIRLVSLLIVVGGWEYFGRQTNPVLFTYPTAVAQAAVKMIASGELWKYLSQSLIVLFTGLGLASVFGIALGLVMARFRVIDIALFTLRGVESRAPPAQ